MKDGLIVLITGLFGGCVLGAGVATVMQYLVPLERVLWLRHSSFWLLHVVAVALVDN